MNLPNKLTILRTLMIPVFLFFLLTDCAGDYSKWIAVVVFILASLTDFLDGHIARKYNLVTNFGKFMDPLADKLLVCSAMIALVGMHRLSSIIAIIIIAREFIISGFRLIASDNGIVIAASYWGKFKTNFQMFMIIMLIIDLGTSTAVMIENILIVIATALTIISLVDYLVKNKQVLSRRKLDPERNNNYNSRNYLRRNRDFIRKHREYQCCLLIRTLSLDWDKFFLRRQ